MCVSSIEPCQSESAPRLQWILYLCFPFHHFSLGQYLPQVATNRCFFQLDRKAACGLVKETLSLIPISPQWAFQLGNYSHVKGDSAESPAALWEHLSPTDANYLAREPSPLCGRSEGSESAGQVQTLPMRRLINGRAVAVKQVHRKRNKWAGCFSHLLIYAFVFRLEAHKHTVKLKNTL